MRRYGVLTVVAVSALTLLVTAAPATSAAAGADRTAAVDPAGARAPVVPAVSPAEPWVAGRRPVRIMPLGDSITAGSGSSGTGGYRYQLGRSLRAAGIPFDFVGSLNNGRGADRDHEGHRGWRTDQLQANIDAWLAASRPDVVLLDIGTNDVWQNATPRRAPHRLSALIDTILDHSPGVRVVVARIGVAGGSRRARLAAGQRTFNRAVPRIVAAKGRRVTMVDMTRVPWVNTTDGVHPNILGYRQMAFQWYQALRRLPLPGATAAPDIANPFPRPRARLSASAGRVRPGGAVRLRGRLVGPLTRVDLGGVAVQLLHRRAAGQWRVLRRSRTAADGSVTFRLRVRHGGDFVLRGVSGRATGQRSRTVPVRV